MTPLIDPRLGDVEDDASSTKRRSLFAMAGSLLAEISFPKADPELGALDIASGDTARPHATDRIGLARYALQEGCGAVQRILAGFVASRRRRIGLDRRAPIVAGGRAGVLVAQLRGGPTRLCAVPRVPPPSHRATVVARQQQAFHQVAQALPAQHVTGLHSHRVQRPEGLLSSTQTNSRNTRTLFSVSEAVTEAPLAMRS